ncbi:MAG TPA: hypothetical protein VG867_00040, partial [Rhizomicrobium sp.]|nr:hypothetical protein [Rhizomicrobium sp.]
FGLLEMSRQRLRAGVIAGSTVTCPHCGGAGIVRSVESTALRVLRGVEEEGQRGKSSAISVKVTPDVAIFMLNKKRQELARIENEYAMSVAFDPDSEIMTGTFEIERTAQRSAEERQQRQQQSISIEAGLATPTDLSEDIEEESEVEEEEIEEEELGEEAASESGADEQRHRDDGENGERSGRRRRRRRGGRNRNRGDRPQQMHEPIVTASENESSAIGEDASEFEGEPQDGASDGPPGEGGQRKRRRRRRGRRGRRGGNGEGQQAYANNLEGVPVDESVRDTDLIVPDETHESLAAAPNSESAPVWSLGESRSTEPAAEPASASSEPATAPKKGWWQRAFSSKG